jgi:hypothetical protein
VKPGISVIVPTCGRVRQLSRALRSVLRQTCVDWDCWVVNDHPPDAAAIGGLIEDLRDDRIRLVSNSSRLGASRSRNLGLEHSRGRVVAFLDDDDVWLPQKLEWHLEEHLKASAPCVVYSDVVLAWEDEVLPPFRAGPNPPPADLLGGLRSGRFMAATTSAVSVDRECFDRAGRFDPALDCMEDLDLFLRLATECPVRYLGKHAVIYVTHAGPSLSTDLELRLASLSLLVERWGTPEIAHRQWVRERVSLRSMVQAALERPLLPRLAELRRFGSIARPPGTGWLGWTWRGIVRDPRSFARLCVFALFGLRLHRLWHRYRRLDPVARDLVAGVLEARGGAAPAEP